ncbi:hypothetical protein GCM10011349_39270 [Novosphingobium indicum]|uniref:Uncharacterized protein n=1 Tax=Novosphingobium indicum TaxID=462949 RepID=A0ABQ2JY13_9SPHN|nr:hypothetical protein [Novosphingobium indicum]GGN59094.1 hypothetical protein GCM10011349_39270 [Novosphingobium indicum]
MADRASASILIGGVIPHSCIPGLFEAIDRDGGRADWEGETLDPASLRPGETLAAFAYAQPGGMFEWTEQFCEGHGIAFVRNSGSCSGVFGPEREVFTGTGTPAQFDMTENEEIVLARSMIRALGTLEAIEVWFESAEFRPPPITIAGGTADTGENGETDNG